MFIVLLLRHHRQYHTIHGGKQKQSGRRGERERRNHKWKTKEEEEEEEEKEKKMKKMGKEGKKSEKNDKNPQVFFCSDGRLWSSSWSQWNEFKSSLYKQTNNTVHKKKRKKSNTHKKKQTLTGLFLSLPGFTEFCAAPRGLELGWVHSKTRLPSFTGFFLGSVRFTNEENELAFPSNANIVEWDFTEFFFFFGDLKRVDQWEN